MIILFLMADLFFLLAVFIKKISIKDLFVYLFFGFVNLYTLCNFFVYQFGLSDRYPAEQLARGDIIEKVLVTSAVALFTFGICILASRKLHESDIYLDIKHIQLYQLFYFLFYPVAFYLNSIDNWTTGTRTGTIAHLAAYSRNMLTVLSVMLLTSRKIKFRDKVLFLALFLIITFKSTQRTNMFIVLTAFIYNVKNEYYAAGFMLSGAGALLSLGALRNGLSAFNFMYSILGEGIFGSWGLLKAIDVIDTYGYSVTHFFKLFGSVLNWFFSQFGVMTNFSTLEKIITDTGQAYYPMGGFFYLSDAYLMHPVLGVIVYTVLIFILYRWSLKHFYNNHSAGYLMILSMLFIMVKGSLSTFTALLLFHLLVYGCLKWISNPKITLKLTMNKVYQM